MANSEVARREAFCHFDQQRTLFEFGSPARDYAGHHSTHVTEQFRTRGYVICRNVRTVQDACVITMELLSYLGKTEPYKSLRYGDFLIAKADRTPVCEQFVQGSFQCLHFDYGLPVLPRANQTLYGVTSLFMPPAIVSSGTITRILSLSELAGSSLSIEFPSSVERLKRYAAQHGDGWRDPSFVNTGRISIFLRFLDAMSPRPKFSEHIDVDSATFIRKCGFPCDSDSGQWHRESELLQEFGIDVVRSERRIALEPGDLLIFDNLRNVHGRLGRRASREIWQMLFGLPDTDAELLGRVMNYAARRQSGVVPPYSKEARSGGPLSAGLEAD